MASIPYSKNFSIILPSEIFRNAMGVIDEGKWQGSLLKRILLDNLKIELSIQKNHGLCQVVVTAKEEENRAIWGNPALDNGKIKTCESQKATI